MRWLGPTRSAARLAGGNLHRQWTTNLHGPVKRPIVAPRRVRVGGGRGRVATAPSARFPPIARPTATPPTARARLDSVSLSTSRAIGARSTMTGITRSCLLSGLVVLRPYLVHCPTRVRAPLLAPPTSAVRSRARNLSGLPLHAASWFSTRCEIPVGMLGPCRLRPTRHVALAVAPR